jgi:hypothetical protein
MALAAAVLGEPGKRVVAASPDEAAPGEPGVVGDLGDGRRGQGKDCASWSVLNSASAMTGPCNGGSKTSMLSGGTLSRVSDSTAAGATRAGGTRPRKVGVGDQSLDEAGPATGTFWVNLNSLSQ